MIAVIVRWSAPASGPQSRVFDGLLSLPTGVQAQPDRQRIEITANVATPVFFTLRFSREVQYGSRVKALVGGREVGCVAVGTGIDLESVRWKARLDSEGTALAEGWINRDYDDRHWRDVSLPLTW